MQQCAVRSRSASPGAWFQTREIAAGPQGACASGLRSGSSRDGYTIVRIRVHGEGRDDVPLLFVHIAAGPGGPRVIGLDRR